MLQPVASLRPVSCSVRVTAECQLFVHFNVRLFCDRKLVEKLDLL